MLKNWPQSSRDAAELSRPLVGLPVARGRTSLILVGSVLLHGLAAMMLIEFGRASRVLVRPPPEIEVSMEFSGTDAGPPPPHAEPMPTRTEALPQLVEPQPLVADPAPSPPVVPAVADAVPVPERMADPASAPELSDPAPEAAAAIPEPPALAPTPPVEPSRAPPKRVLAAAKPAVARPQPVSRPLPATPSAAQDPPASSPAPAVASSTSPAAPPRSGVDAGWSGALSAWLQSHKTYPDEARRRGEEGNALIRFTVDRAGRVLEYVLVRGTGSASLDAAVARLLTGAQVPAFPASMTDASITVTVQVRYVLQRSHDGLL